MIETWAPVSVRKMLPVAESVMERRHESELKGLVATITGSLAWRFLPPMHMTCDNSMLHSQDVYGSNRRCLCSSKSGEQVCLNNDDRGGAEAD